MHPRDVAPCSLGSSIQYFREFWIFPFKLRIPYETFQLVTLAQHISITAMSDSPSPNLPPILYTGKLGEGSHSTVWLVRNLE